VIHTHVKDPSVVQINQTSAYVHPHACACTCICIHIHRRTYVHIHTYAHAHIHTYMHTHIHIHKHAHLYTHRKSQQQRLKASNNIIDAHTHPYTLQRSAEEEVRKQWDRMTGAWNQISKHRRRVNVSYDPSMVTALQHGTGWMRNVSKRLVSGRRKKGEASTNLFTVHGQRTSC